MDEQKEYLTPEKYKEFEEELVYLKKDKRKEIADSLEYAKSLGDLSENAEYQEARDAQAQLENRIIKLESILQSAEIVSSHKTDHVSVGSIVTVQKEGTRTPQTFTLVGSEEIDTEAGKISVNSPVGRGLLRKKKGETATVMTPAGEFSYKVIKIE